MSAENFPDPRIHRFPEWALIGDYYFDSKDIISFGDPLTVANLLEAYRKGIFPWHIRGLPLPWFCPEMRAVLDFEDLKISRSLRKGYRSSTFSISIDTGFDSVIRSCAGVRRKRENGTWITQDFVRAYCELHKKGVAHSVEVRDGSSLVGGLYGVDAGGVFCGESMFFRRSNASKFALLHLIDHLKKRGSTWIDIQVMTPHFKSLGAKELTRQDFLARLDEAQSGGLELFRHTLEPGGN